MKRVLAIFEGFRNFLMRGKVLDLAVAVIVGTAFNQVINSLVSDIFTPIIGSLKRIPDFAAWKVGPIALGKFINTVLNFVVVSAIIYFFVVVPMQKVQEQIKKEEAHPTPSPPEPPEEIKLLRAILEELKKKN